MSGSTPKGENQRRQIMDTAIRLFARKGYASAGMREIALEAGVNLAMINYYFGTKINLLKSIMAEFFDKLEALFVAGNQEDSRPCGCEEKTREYARKLTAFCQENIDLVKVCIAELPMDMPEMAGFKNMRLQSLLGSASREFATGVSAGNDSDGISRLISGSALGSMVIMHFLFKPLFESLLGDKLKSDFYESFPDRVSDLFLFGTCRTGSTQSVARGAE